MEKLPIKIRKTSELSNSELIEIMKAQIKVFVVEQNANHQEIDDKDNEAIHVFMARGSQIIAYTRIVPHQNQKDISFGRVLVAKAYRHLKLGRTIVAATIAEIHQRYPQRTIKIAAQNYLRAFYASFGFKPISKVYLENNIPHVDMVLEA